MDIETLEAIAYADDRSDALAALVPGSEDYYFHACLHHQNQAELARVDELLTAWIKRYGRTERAHEIERRQLLLRYDSQPDRALVHIQDQLGLRFDHQRDVEGSSPDHPSALDASTLDRETWFRRALQHSGLSGFRDEALEWLTTRAGDLGDKRRRSLLERIERPDHPGLMDLVRADLADRRTGGFGSLAIHSRLLPEQLDLLVRDQPALRDDLTMVALRLRQAAPNPDVAPGVTPSSHVGASSGNGFGDLDQRAAHLDRLWRVAEPLGPVHNSLKAHILYHRLDLERHRRVRDRDTFLAYLRLPRNAAYVPVERYRKVDRSQLATLGAGHASDTGLSAVSDDQDLVRDYLLHFLEIDRDTSSFDGLVREDLLRLTQVSAKVFAGVGDQEEWSALLDEPETYRGLTEQVDLEIARHNRETFALDDAVTLDVWVKNVPTLVVKVFEIDAYSYYTSADHDNPREIDTSIDLDGLVATHETTHHHDEAPIRRVLRSFELPQLAGPGIHVVEFIGNGKSSRALIRKGTLRFVERLGAAGHVFTVLDSAGTPVPDATIWLAGREYHPRDDGSITVPYSTRPGRETLLLCHGELTIRDSFYHRSESYSLSAGFHVDREQLIAGESAVVAIRPILRLGDVAVTIRLLQDLTLAIAATDKRGTTSHQEITLPSGESEALGDDDVIQHRFAVPEDLASLHFALRGVVRSVTEQRDVSLTASGLLSINAIDSGPLTDDVHLERTEDGYALQVLGKSGEVRSGRPVNVQLWHRDFTFTRWTSLTSDDRGRASLGPLHGVTRVEATLPGHNAKSWNLGRDICSLPDNLHALASETIVLPHLSSPRELQRISLLERGGGEASRGNQPVYLRDLSGRVTVEDDHLRVAALDPGDYDLAICPDNTRVTLRVTRGHQQGRWAVGEHRLLELQRRPRLQITGMSIEPASTTSSSGDASASPGGDEVDGAADDAGSELVIQLRGAGSRTRVHVVVTRFVPEYDLSAALGEVREPEPTWVEITENRSHYVSGRDIGDEYRYVLERRQAARFPGNMLDRPSALLDPWDIRSTATEIDHAADGGAYGGSIGAKKRKGGRPAPRPKPATGASQGFANLDFLARSASAWYDLRPDDDGVVRIASAKLDGVQLIRVLAVAPSGQVYRQWPLASAKHEHRDLRLEGALDPDSHLAERQQVTALAAGESLVIDDIKTASVEVYDTVDRAYALLMAVSQNSTLTEFRFAVDWPTLSDEDKRAKYSKYACHELSFFLQRKDPAFFAEVVQPHLRNKMHKTFMDHYLIEADLEKHLAPWAYGRLNVVERILLARRVAGQSGPTRRHIDDLCDLLPPDPERDNRLFDAALMGSALADGDRLGFAEAKKGARAADKTVMLAASSLAAGLRGGVQALGGPGGPPAAPARMAMAPPPQSRSRAKPAPPPAPMAAMAPPPMEMAKEEKADDTMDEMLDLEFDEFDMDDARRDVAARDEVDRLYRALDKTREWAENNYYRRRITDQGPELVTVNRFWRDFAAHEADGDRAFTSRHLAHAASNFTEMMLALAVLDLPFEAAKPSVTYRESRMELRASSDCVVFHQEIKPVGSDRESPDSPIGSSIPILVSQSYLRHDDRHDYDGNLHIEKYVTGEMLIHTVYVCQVVLTNPTSTERTLDVLLQIPQGAIPVNGGFATRGQKIVLGAHDTATIEYGFYFPTVGRFGHFPVHVTHSEELVAAAEPRTLEVVERLTEVDTGSWAHVSQHGEPDQVLAFLRDNNLERLDLEPMAWRMRDHAFYRAALDLLNGRHVYHHTLWSYSVLHRDTNDLATFLQHADGFAASLGSYFSSPVVTIDAITRHRYEHLEYAPLVNARAHRLGKRVKILNDAFDRQYHEFLRQLAYCKTLDDDHRLAAAYYLFLQDRIADALAMFDRIDRDDDARAARLTTALQYDYVAAYAAMYRGDLDTARELATRHAGYPVDRWRKRFQTVLAVLDEAGGSTAQVIDEDDAEQAHSRLAGEQATFDFTVADRRIKVTYRNLARCAVHYYLMDIELMFSRQPFLAEKSGRFAMVKPNRKDVIELPADAHTHGFSLPEDYSSANLSIEVVAAGQRKSQVHYANDLIVQVADHYGRVQVHRRSTGRPLPSTYVKVYARKHGGEVAFYKDGYTDIRGAFDYASLSTNELDRVERFAILVASDDHGALVREAAPPKR